MLNEGLLVDINQLAGNPRSRDTLCTRLPPPMCHRPANDAMKAQSTLCGQTIGAMRLPNLYLTHPSSQWRYPQ